MGTATAMERTELRTCLRALLFTLAGLGGAGAEAGQWVFEPRVVGALIGTDNVRLAKPGEEEADVLGFVSPGIYLSGKGNRLDLELDYQFHSGVSLTNQGRNYITHQMRSGLKSELLQDWLYFDATAGLGQVVLDARESIPLDNLGFVGNQADYVRYEFLPAIRHAFGRLVTLDAVYKYGGVRYTKGASDADIEGVSVRLASGPRSQILTWTAKYYYEDIRRETAPNAVYDSTAVDGAYRLNQHWSLVGQAGYENNFIERGTLTVNGAYWGAGVRWHPSRKFSIEAQTGDRLDYGVIQITPLTRMGLVVTYRNRSVGLNPGPVWFWNLYYRGRHSRWEGSYTEDTQLRQRQVEYEGDLGVFAGDGRLYNPATGDPVYCNGLDLTNCLTLTNDAYERKSGYLQGRWNTAYNEFTIRASVEERDYLTNVRHEDARSATGIWVWRLGVRTKSRLSGSLVRLWYSRDDRTDWRRILDWRIVRDLTRKAEGSIGYSYYSRRSTDAGAEYDENRITLRLRVVF